MATPVYLTGLEGFPNATTANGGGLGIGNPNGNVTVSTAQAHSGARSLRINPSAAAGWVQIALSTPTLMVVSIYIRFASFPTSDSTLFFGHVTAGSGLRIEFNQANSRIDASVGGSGTQTGLVVSLDTWYRVDARMNCASSGNSVIDWQIATGDGSATSYTQVSVAQADTTFIGLRLGSTSSETFDIYYDDIIISQTSGDYPIGPHGTERLAPTSDGTHNAGTNIIEDNAGTDIGTTTAYDKLDSVPPDATTYIRQAANGTGNYAEVQFANITATHSSIIAARAVLAYTSETTTANRGACIVSKDDFASHTEVWGNPTTTQDYSDGSTSNLFYKGAIISGATDDTTVNALEARIGYSGDASPDPYWVDLWIEVAYVISSGTQYSQSASGAMTPAGAISKQGSKVTAGTLTSSGAIAKQDNKALTGALTPAGTLLKETAKTLAGALTSSGALTAVRLFFKDLAGTLTSSGALIKSGAKTLSGSLTPSGALSRSVSKFLAGTLTSSGTLSTVRIYLKDLAGTLTSSGALIKSSAKNLVGAITPSGALSKLTSKVVSGALSSAGALARTVNKLLAGVLSPTGGLDSALEHPVDTSVTFELFIPPDDFGLIVAEDPTTILAAPDDFDLVVPVEQTVYTDWYADAFLTDEDGDQLVDESGNLLIVPSVSTENVYVLHVPPDDYDIVVNEET